MPNDTQAAVVDTTATAPAGEAAATQQTTTPPAGGTADAGQEQQTTSKADGKTDENGQQQNGEEGTTEQSRDEQGRYKSSKIQKRFDELTHARHAAEREAAHWRAIAEGRQAKPAPQAHDFATDEDYEFALLDHRIEERARQVVADNAQQTADRYQKDSERLASETYNERVQEVSARIPDFVEVVSKADVPITDEMQAALKSSAHGPEIVYQLAKNPAEAQRIASLPTAQMYMALGAMEAGVSVKAAPVSVARTTSAPPPAATSGTGAAPPNTDPSKMTMAEYEAMRRAQGAKYI